MKRANRVKRVKRMKRVKRRKRRKRVNVQFSLIPKGILMIFPLFR